VIEGQPMSEPIMLYAEELWDSPYVFSVFVALHEKKLPFVERVLRLSQGEQRAGDYPARSLTARVPCIEHDGFVLSESLAIHEYLDEVFPEPRLLPATTRERARARQVLGWLRSDLMPLREDRSSETMFYARADKPLSERGPASARKLLETADRLIPKGEGPLFGTWCIADADLTFMLQRLIANDDPVPERVRAYATAQWQRASVQAFVTHPRPAKTPA
jgi:glutathione S-transferase